MTREEFIKKAQEAHGDKYDYSKIPSELKASDNVVIVCPIHGEFTQNARTHYRGHGCPNCKAEKTRQFLTLTTETFLKKYHDKFGDEYDTSLVDYKDFETKVKMICPIHGVWD